MPDKDLVITSAVLQKLIALRAEPKFHKDWDRFYSGAPTEEIRRKAESAMNKMLERLLTGIKKSPKKSYVLAEFSELLNSFVHHDSEEREECCEYCERVMKLLEIESSDGLLNTWLYGFDPEKRS